LDLQNGLIGTADFNGSAHDFRLYCSQAGLVTNHPVPGRSRATLWSFLLIDLREGKVRAAAGPRLKLSLFVDVRRRTPRPERGPGVDIR